MKLSLFPPDKVQAARESVADAMIENARAIRASDPYAAHVPEHEKDAIMASHIASAEELRKGLHDGKFWAWQRIYESLTGECVPLLPPRQPLNQPANR